MNRQNTTLFLGKLLETDRLNKMGSHWAKEVSVDPWSANGKRVDYMQFSPGDQMSVSGIEKGIFTCYEIKSCEEDVYSGNGLNFLGEKNYIVTTMECYKDILPGIRGSRLTRHIDKCFPESSHYYGIMVAIPQWYSVEDEFENPTKLPENPCDTSDWKLATVIPCRVGPRKRSMTELLFCMLRSGK